jgi:hypothetical protein
MDQKKNNKFKNLMYQNLRKQKLRKTKKKKTVISLKNCRKLKEPKVTNRLKFKVRNYQN